MNLPLHVLICYMIQFLHFLNVFMLFDAIFKIILDIALDLYIFLICLLMMHLNFSTDTIEATSMSQFTHLEFK